VDAIPTAPVIVDGTTLFSLRGLSAYPAQRRAQEVASRIASIAENRAILPSSLRLVEAANGTRILAANEPVLTVLDADADLEQVDRQVLAHVFLNRISEAIQNFRQDREPALLARQALHALAATIAFVLAVAAALWAIRRSRVILRKRYGRKFRDVGETLKIIHAGNLQRMCARGIRFLFLVIGLVGTYLYLQYVLSLFPWTRGLANRLLAILLDPLRIMGTSLLHAIPDIAFLIVLGVVTRYVLAAVRLFFEAVEKGVITLGNFDPEWSSHTYRLVRIVVIAFAAIVAYPYIPGSNTQAFQGISVFIGLLFSLGSVSFIGNLIAGYAITYRRTFRTGDRVKIGDQIGDVERPRLMVTYLRTPRNEIVVVPNSKIINEEVVNFSARAREKGLILHTTVGIGYGTPWRQVEAMLLEAATRTDGLLRQPEPYVLLRELGDFSTTYEINVYCDQPSAMMKLYSLLHQNILDVFNEYGVQIMTPAYEGDPDTAKVVPRSHWYDAPARPENGDRREPALAIAEDKPSLPQAS
jgi:small-conductance mechanosensitive channel